MKRKALLKAVAGAVAVTTVLTACGANDKPVATGGEVKPGGTVRLLSDGATAQYDPAKSGSLVVTALGLVHRRLTSWKVTPGQDTTIVPDLATDTGRPSEGGKTWTFTLKDNVKYNDGSPIKSQDIKWGLERTYAAAFSGGLTYHKDLLSPGLAYKGPFEGGKELDSIETPDDKTIVFHLARPYGDWNWIASTPAFSPVPKGKGEEADYGNHPVASGPYVLEKYERGKEARLVRNPHWDRATDDTRKANPDTIVFQLGQDTSVISKRLIDDSGDDQSAFSIPFASPAQLAQIQANPSAKSRVVTSESGALAFLTLNTQRGKLVDPKVRQAFQYAVDKAAYQVASAGNAQLAGDIATTLITPGLKGREQFDLYPAPPSGDPEKAKKLLAESGLPNGLDGLVLATRNENSYPEKAAAIQAALARANIKITIKVLDEDTYTSEVDTKGISDFDLTLASWQPDIPSANANIQPLFQSTEIGNGGVNESRYSNPEIDRLITEAQATVDPAEAGKKWAALDKKILGDSPVVPLIYTRNSFLHGSKFGNVVIGRFPAYPDYRQFGLIQ
ncbi:ABC transporter substrate-binding protein [Amycolatopsis azurea]|uniref:ABC transporter substrate-binding protein n=1 Tax=Amycolatopsis azurea DSM 43854 TaxID=1238180 RepID=M2QPQ9_9PSEU|nr:ABC transporter substrate-binding protein [Amycolatopsis azurea]EMD28666.1 periplasmic oligopeptide-binding protein OppA [Amycolatopsis azurea DSM 43854]OOC08090.1 ABC transporter substrate-binding protein [Amycolatopsis azurea DSM 43854]